MNPSWLWPMTALSWVFFNSSQNIHLHNFTRHWCETGRPAITRVFRFTILENWDNICQLPFNWDLSRLPKLLKVMEKYLAMILASSFGTLGEIPLGSIDLCESIWSRKSQTNSGSVGKAVAPLAMVLQQRALGSQGPVLWRKALHVSTWSASLFVRWLISSSNEPMLSLNLLLLLTYFLKCPVYHPSQCWPAWLLIAYIFSLQQQTVVLTCHLYLLPVSTHFHSRRRFPAQPFQTSASLVWFLTL